MNVSEQPFGSRNVRKAFPGFLVADPGKIIFHLQDFDQGKKSSTLLDLFRNLGKRFVHGVEICPRFYLEAVVLLLGFISPTLRLAECLGHAKGPPFIFQKAGEYTAKKTSRQKSGGRNNVHCRSTPINAGKRPVRERLSA